MICFELELNGKRLATAGIPGRAVLTAGVTWVQGPERPNEERRREMHVRLGGMESNDPATSGTHLEWIAMHPKVGDTIQVRILDLPVADPPLSREDSMTGEQVKEDKAKSARHYLAEYQKQRVALDRQIRVIENAIAAEKKKPAAGKRAVRKKRK